MWSNPERIREMLLRASEELREGSHMRGTEARKRWELAAMLEATAAEIAAAEAD